jgi:hypothetical protein
MCSSTTAMKRPGTAYCFGVVRGRKRAAADTLLNYVSDRRAMIAYPEFQKKGWQIGSGPTEATCKTLTTRLKGSGMRWTPRTPKP